jgi:hypothetical protein
MIRPLVVGAGVLLVSLVFYALATAFLVRLVVHLIRGGYDGRKVWKNAAAMIVVTFITAVMHLSQIALWAAAFILCGEVSNFEQALYMSGENYTSLGYGDVLLSERWRLLGPVEAINGLLLFGLSTALLFAIINHLITNRLKHQLGHEGTEESPPGGGIALEQQPNTSR